MKTSSRGPDPATPRVAARASTYQSAKGRARPSHFGLRTVMRAVTAIPRAPRARRRLQASFLALVVAGRSASSAFASPGDASPRVRVKNIGLHIGGGPNDAATKAPFLRQIESHFDAFRRCYGLIESPSAHGTFGIDLLIAKEGGNPVTSNPRTSMKGSAFRDCAVSAFAAISFEPPRRGATKLSYALSFDPE